MFVFVFYFILFFFCFWKEDAELNFANKDTAVRAESEKSIWRTTISFSVHNVDIWNVIEAFRENALNTLEPSSTLNVTRLETLLSSLFHALNKRVPVSQQAKVDATTALLMNWLLAAYTTGYVVDPFFPCAKFLLIKLYPFGFSNCSKLCENYYSLSPTPQLKNHFLFNCSFIAY